MSNPFTYVKDSAGCYEALNHLMKQKAVGFDLETTGLDPHKDKATLAGFASDEKTFVVDTRNPEHLKIFAPLLESEEIYKVDHGGTFEYKMTKGTSGIDTENHFCTFLGEKALTAGQQFDGFSLEAVTKKYLGIERDKDLQKSFIGHTGDFSQEQLQYNADDAFYQLPLARAMQKRAQEDGVLKVWKIENGALPAFGDIEFYGQKIDVPAWQNVMAMNKENERKAKIDLDKWFLPIVGTDLFGAMGIDGGEGTGGAAINYNSVPAVLHALQMMGIKVDEETIANTSKKSMNKVKDHGAIRALMDYRSAVKLYGTYGQTYLNAINPGTGRVHFYVKQYGTDTGRPACGGGLNCLNIPRLKHYRQAFGTDPGRFISTVDYSAAELRILADLSGDKLMIDGFNSGVDFHCYVASMLFSKEVTKKNENAHLRDPTKTLNFGIAYGMSPFSLYEKLVYELGQKVTLDDCKDLFNRYNRTFKTAVDWLKSQQKLASTEFEMHNINGRKRAWFRPNQHAIRETIVKELTRNGKIKLTPSMEDQIPSLLEDKVKAHTAAIQREGANFKIQSVNADFAKKSMAEIRKAFKKRGYDSRMYNMVYDEIVMDSKDSCAQAAHELQKKIMIEEANKMLSKVPMLVEGHLESCWTK